MQDRYTGDLGDFGKYGLLRTLCDPADDLSPRLSLGVVWYLYPHDEINSHGMHTSYLNSSARNDRRFRNCDPSLYDGLKSIVDGGQRSVLHVRERKLLPAGTTFFDEPLSLRDLPSAGTTRKRRRDDWEARARQATAECDLVFVDPDNGLEVTSAPRESNRGPKYVFFKDLEPYVERGQSLVVYQHMSRQGGADQQLSTALAKISNEFTGSDPFALRYHRGTARAFLIIPTKRHADTLRTRASRFLQTAWEQHFTPYP